MKRNGKTTMQADYHAACIKAGVTPAYAEADKIRLLAIYNKLRDTNVLFAQIA